mmetsp:Transcript_48901/g.72664  ORF Transcript_48901/g.72664 Transcript_48901/m.72664 type:complete len:209 (-) Transcript_48901:173-799(-)
MAKTSLALTRTQTLSLTICPTKVAMTPSLEKHRTPTAATLLPMTMVSHLPHRPTTLTHLEMVEILPPTMVLGILEMTTLHQEEPMGGHLHKTMVASFPTPHPRLAWMTMTPSLEPTSMALMTPGSAAKTCFPMTQTHQSVVATIKHRPRLRCSPQWTTASSARRRRRRMTCPSTRLSLSPTLKTRLMRTSTFRFRKHSLKLKLVLNPS